MILPVIGCEHALVASLVSLGIIGRECPAELLNCQLLNTIARPRYAGFDMARMLSGWPMVKSAYFRSNIAIRAKI
jgi:hypothetical protein